MQAVHGNFSGTKQQEIVVIRGKILELLRPDTNTGKVHTVLSVEAFGEVRSIVPFRLTGGNKGTQHNCLMFGLTFSILWSRTVKHACIITLYCPCSCLAAQIVTYVSCVCVQIT